MLFECTFDVRVIVEDYFAFTLRDFSGHFLLIKMPRPTGKAKLIKAIT